MWRFYLRVAAQTSEPVVLVVDGDKQDVRLVRPESERAGKEQ